MFFLNYAQMSKFIFLKTKRLLLVALVLVLSLFTVSCPNLAEVPSILQVPSAIQWREDTFNAVSLG